MNTKDLEMSRNRSLRIHLEGYLKALKDSVKKEGWILIRSAVKLRILQKNEKPARWPCKKAGREKTEAISAGSSSQSKIQCVGGLEREENTLPATSLHGLLNVKTLGHLVMSSEPIPRAALKGPCITCYATKE